MLEFDFKVKAGDFHLSAGSSQDAARMGLFGPSGCGKTTLLNCLAGLLRPHEGHISLNGRTLFDARAKVHVPPHKRAIGYVFQDGRLFPHMTVRENIEYGRRGTSAGPGLAELSDVLDLSALLERCPKDLSGGERQRVALARALAAGPELLLLDEPLESVDQDARLRILTYVKDTYEKWQLPFVYVSHSLSEVMFLAAKVWDMQRGQITRTVPPADLLARSNSRLDPVSNIVSGVVADIPSRLGRAAVRCREQLLNVPSEGLCMGDAVTVALPARDIILASSPPHGLSARNVFPATIRRLEGCGGVLWVTVEAGGNEFIAELTEGAGREMELRPGLTVHVVIKAHSITVSSMKKGNGRHDEH